MKKISMILAGVAMVFAMSSCDKLKEPYSVKTILVKGDTIALEAADTLFFDGKKVVLLEDYTGVKCNNCPAAAELAAQLQEQYEGHLIVMGVHPKGALQMPNGGFPDFRTEDGNIWNGYFNISSYPNGTVDRIKAIGSPEWSSAVAEEMSNDQAYIRLIVKTKYDELKRELTVTTHSKMLVDMPSELSLTTCLMEDSIVGKQVTPEGINAEYMHRHVFRGTADSQTWGGSISDNPEEVTAFGDIIPAGSRFIRTMKFTVDTAYNANQLYIVSFISRSDNHYVFQAAEKKIW